jgi:Fe-S cluster assembly iron-binding protein IscA
LLIHRDTVATIIVPHAFWPQSFRDQWADRAASIAANHPWITITDEAAEVMERVAREEREGRDWSLRIWIERDPDGGLDRVRHDFDRDYDPERDRVFHSNGIRIIVSRDDAAELRGFKMYAGADDMYWLG